MSLAELRERGEEPLVVLVRPRARRIHEEALTRRVAGA